MTDFWKSNSWKESSTISSSFSDECVEDAVQVGLVDLREVRRCEDSLGSFVALVSHALARCNIKRIKIQPVAQIAAGHALSFLRWSHICHESDGRKRSPLRDTIPHIPQYHNRTTSKYHAVQLNAFHLNAYD